MTDQDRMVLEYGEPEKRDDTTFLVGDTVHRSSQWVYSWGYVYFKDGRHVAVQSK